MANTYSDATGVLIFDGPANITPVIRMLFDPFKLDEEPESSGTEHYIAVLSEDNNYDWDSYLEMVVETAEEAFGIDFTGQTEPADVLEVIGTHFGADLSALIDQTEFGDFVSIGEAVRLALLLQDGHNLIGYCLEGCWHCDRPRLWDFGGWASYAGARYSLDQSTSSLLQFARDLDEHLGAGPEQAMKLMAIWVTDHIDGIRDESVRAQVAHRLAQHLSERNQPLCNTTETEDVVQAGAEWSRTIYIEAYATDEGAGPGYARIDVTPTFISTLQSLRALCAKRDLTEVRVACAPDEWGLGASAESLRLLSPELVVTPWTFWFTDSPEGVPFEIETRGQGVDAFIGAVSGPGAPIYLGVNPADIENGNRQQPLND